MAEQQTLVHLTHQPKDSAVALVACITTQTQYRMSGVTKNHPNYQLTGDPRAVTCPMCKQTEVYKKILDQLPR